MQEHTLTVARTARYYTLGGASTGEVQPGILSESIKNVWFVLHGYGQLAQYFLRRFDVVAGEETLVVAPEGLSRLYLNSDYSKIGASWLTREARDYEIADYVVYLNQLHDTLLTGRDPSTVRITLLGFSQGATTACRWLNRSDHIRFDRLILWAGFFANGLADLVDPGKLANVPVQYVYGDQDDYLTKLPDLDAYRQRLLAELPTLEIIPFSGRHQIDREVLRRLA